MLIWWGLLAYREEPKSGQERNDDVPSGCGSRGRLLTCWVHTVQEASPSPWPSGQLGDQCQCWLSPSLASPCAQNPRSGISFSGEDPEGGLGLPQATACHRWAAHGLATCLHACGHQGSDSHPQLSSERRTDNGLVVPVPLLPKWLQPQMRWGMDMLISGSLKLRWEFRGGQHSGSSSGLEITQTWGREGWTCIQMESLF